MFTQVKKSSNKYIDSAIKALHDLTILLTGSIELDNLVTIFNKLEEIYDELNVLRTDINELITLEEQFLK